ncbi:TPA: AAA family ATPase [Photobacterium damselae]
MHLKSIEILNLCENDKTVINFDKQVTFLTGINGSGKSTLLNIIYDSLNFNNLSVSSRNNRPSTSKNRFWSSLSTFSDGAQSQFMLLPRVDNEGLASKITSLFNAQDGYHSLDTIKHIQKLFSEYESENVLNYIGYNNDIKGEVASYLIKPYSGVDREDLYIKDLESKNLSFLYQDDKKTLHNLDNSKMNFECDYWFIYGSSIDQRFAYVRDAFQVYEAKINKSLIDELKNLKSGSLSLSSIEFAKNFDKPKEVDDLISCLNKYFNMSNKEITRDFNNKITIQSIDSHQPIEWHLLSRGEKTLIYLFLSVFLYRDKISLFLLDEPDISLHVKWQKTLVKDLLMFANKNQFIIATHSPSLIRDGWLTNCMDIRL